MNNMDGFQRRREKKKESIRRAALELFSAHGVQKVSIAEIAEKANVSQVTIYNHFGSKDELLKDVLIQLAYKKYEEYNEILESNIPFPEKIEKMVFNKRETVKMFNEDFLNAYFSNDPEIQAFTEDFYNNTTIPLIRKIIEQGKKEGYIHHDISSDAFWFYITLFINRPELYAKLDKTTMMDITTLFFYGLLGKPPIEKEHRHISWGHS
ncbi:MAG: TetR/AcrR family transcriptional regulator [Bacillota bacterium]